MATRRYEQRLRAEAAEQTRRRIIDAVIEQLQERPSEAVSIDRIAQIADVARSTVYTIFGSRAGLFDAVGADVFERSGYAELVQAARSPDARARLWDGFRAATRMFAANRDIVRALHSMAQLDDEAVGGAVRRMEDARAAGMARLARALGRQGLLRSDVSVKQAAHTLWVLTSFESFDLLFTGRGLSTDRVAELLATTAERALLA